MGSCNAQKRTVVLVKTTMGDMKIKLYEDTPLHRENFVKLVKENFYDSLLFHRVIKDFMIQAGDPTSKNAPASQMLGSGGPGYTVPAEILPNHFHKKGVLSAARQGDQVNPKKESSGSQFYVVQGKVYKAEELTQMETSINSQQKDKLIMEMMQKPGNEHIRTKIDSLQKANDRAGFNKYVSELRKMVEAEYKQNGKFKFTEEQVQAYTTTGGVPHLDREYTVFGEVIEGIDVIDKIAVVPTARGDRPETDVKIISIEIVK